MPVTSGMPERMMLEVSAIKRESVVKVFLTSAVAQFATERMAELRDFGTTGAKTHVTFGIIARTMLATSETRERTMLAMFAIEDARSGTRREAALGGCDPGREPDPHSLTAK